MKHIRIKTCLALAILFFATGRAHAQLSGHNILGDFGMKSGSQAPPGTYLAYYLYGYDTSKIVGQDGREFPMQGELQLWGHFGAVAFVTKQKILGANYGATVVFPVLSSAIEAPRINLAQGTYGFSDMYIQPINLGWHTKRADVTTWYGLYAPTGRYAPGANDNTGLGMWSHEFALGSTLFLDENHTFHASALGAYELHTKKRDADAKVGQLLTIEGGVGKTSKKILDLGMAYYLQWKMTNDSGLAVPALVEDRLGKNRNFGFGPEASLLLPVSKDFSKLLVFDFRYLFETGTRLDTKGQTLLFSLTFKVR
jgi:hypothetical protein